MSLFFEWNSLLLQNYFSPAQAGRDVWIPTTNLELESIGVHLGGSAGLIEAVKQGPTWLANNESIVIKATDLVVIRNMHANSRPSGYCDPGRELEIYKGVNAPTYLPYLALWVLAQSEPGRGFYQKVSDLIGMEFNNEPLVTDSMVMVWKDLEFWSNNYLDDKSKSGTINTTIGSKFGYFKFNVLGPHRFVGMAYAQSMITGKDMEGIHRLFAGCKLQPGQDLHDNDFKQLLEHGGQSYFLSKGCREAMGDVTYTEQLRLMLAALLESWDGVVPKNISNNSLTAIGQEESLWTIDEEILIILQLKGDSGDQWDIGWRVPASVTGHNYNLELGEGNCAKAKLELNGTHISCMTNVNQSLARVTLDSSARHTIDGLLNYSDFDGSTAYRKFYLLNKKIRVLAWDKPDYSQSESLYEREMPIEGPAYLLYSISEYSNLELSLSNEKIEHQFIDEINGLPDGWRLICIEKVEKLSSEQRAIITEEELVVTTKSRLRFVGGKSISGLGTKKYQYYDLPIIELEGDANAQISAEGLSFEIISDEEADKSRVRRYRFSLNDGSGSAFKIKVRLEDEILNTTKLLVLQAGGLGTAQHKNFSIDKFGKALANEDGLMGAVIGQKHDFDWNLKVIHFEMNKESLASIDQEHILKSMKTNVSCLFLDSIACTVNGSMTFGIARDQIRRLASQKNIDNIEPGLLLHDLRRRGHVEIEIDVKGHMVRINAVKPTLYSLPLQDRGELFYGICGSLRLQHWEELVKNSGVNLYVENVPQDGLPIVRVGCTKAESTLQLSSSGNFKLINLPILQVIQWLGSIQEIKDDLNWYLDRGSNPVNLQKLTPAKGLFIDKADMTVDQDLKYELFRFEDPQIVGMRVYKLGRNLGDGLSKYSFIPDSRWGVWSTIWAFADYVKDKYKIEDASPWPFHYEIVAGDLWLPARIEPPMIIGRALALCSGAGPMVIDCVGNMDGEAVFLRHKNGTLIGKVSPVYSDMHTGKWLRYRWVPRAVAQHIAGLLGGELKEF